MNLCLLNKITAFTVCKALRGHECTKGYSINRDDISHMSIRGRCKGVFMSYHANITNFKRYTTQGNMSFDNHSDLSGFECGYPTLPIKNGGKKNEHRNNWSDGKNGLKHSLKNLGYEV